LGFRIVLAVGLLFATRALADLSPSNPSINGTGEVLPKAAVELGLMSNHYGLNEDWMIRIPSAAALVGYGRAELRRRFRLGADERISPYLFGETPKKFGFGSDYGFNFGESRSQSLTVGARAQFTQRLESSSNGPRKRLHTIFLPNIEYDYYGRGNVFYAGIAEYLPYFGHTWSFSFWNIGLIAGPYTSMIPLPYVYIRF
jgi:hypothetical protein